MIRSLAANYKRIIVAAPAGSRYLYEFANEFIPLETAGFSGAKGGLSGDAPRPDANWHVKHPSVLWNEFGAEEYTAITSGPPSPTTKLWRDLAPFPAGGRVADILCAFRPEKVVENRVIDGKNYAEDQCAQLVGSFLAAGLSVACFGGAENYCFENTIDLRGAPLEIQCAALSAARCAVGPSSGTLHLASLCRCPHVTWSAIRPQNIALRYRNHWNPFGTPVRFFQAPDPSPDEIYLTVVEFVQQLETQAV